MYLAGNVYKTTIHQLANNQLATINTHGFNPIILASYNNQLIFTAEETNITQIYLLTADNKVKKLSNMQENQIIHHLEIAGDTFVVSYARKVVIYRLQDGQLVLNKEIPGYNRGVIDASGKYLLLSNSNNDEETSIIEKRLNDLKPTGRKVTGAKLAFYHQSDIVYLDKDKELFRLTVNGPKTIANNIAAAMFEHISVIDDELYYLEWFTSKRPVFKLDLITGIKEPVLLEGIKPILIQAANSSLFIGATTGVQATLVVGDIVMYE